MSRQTPQPRPERHSQNFVVVLFYRPAMEAAHRN